jgi:hypothetical protein
MCWYHKNTPENREFAQRFLNPTAPVQPTAPVPATSTIATTTNNIISVQFAAAAPEPAPVTVTPGPARIPPWRARLIRSTT